MRINFIRRRALAGSKVKVEVRINVIVGVTGFGTSAGAGRTDGLSFGLSFRILGFAPVGGPGASPSVLGVSDRELEPAGLKAQEGMPKLGSEQGGFGPLHSVKAMPEVLNRGTS